MRTLTPDDLLSAWPDIHPINTAPSMTGTNNRSWRIETAGAAYFLQVLSNVSDRDQLDAQHRLMRHIASCRPGFAVPQPIPTSDGVTAFETGMSGWNLAVLTQVIPGQHPDVTDPAVVEACGGGLARLHMALATFDEPGTAAGKFRIDRFVDVDVIDRIALPDDLLRDVHSVVERLDVVLACIARSTHHIHLLHGDYYPSNVLVNDGAVSGVLDFETVILGPRVVDVAIGVQAFAFAQDDINATWERCRHFIHGYAQYQSLTDVDRVLFANSIVVREAHSLLHWAHRHERGLIPSSAIGERATRLIGVDRWVTQHHARLMSLIDGACCP